MAKKPNPPIFPRDPEDPQGTDSLDAQAAREFKRRLRECGKAYIDALEQIPAELATNARTYRYRLDQGLLQWLLGNAGALVDSVMLEGGPDALWFFDGYVAVATKRGVAQQMRNIAAQSPAYKAARGTVILSEPHLQRMLLLRTRVFEDMKGFTQQIKTDLSRILADGMGRGQGPLAVAQNIREQLKVEQHRAERIARTEIATAQRRAKWDEADDAATEYGSRILEMHFSALSTTTRASHAARHGRLFTRDECRDWWAQGATAINCKCSTLTTVVNEYGEPVAPGVVARANAIKAKMEKRGYAWAKEE